MRAHEILRFDYGPGSGDEPPRRVEPHHVVTWDGRWYLVAWDLDRSDWRTFPPTGSPCASPTDPASRPGNCPAATWPPSSPAGSAGLTTAPSAGRARAPCSSTCRPPPWRATRGTGSSRSSARTALPTHSRFLVLARSRRRLRPVRHRDRGGRPGRARRRLRPAGPPPRQDRRRLHPRREFLIRRSRTPRTKPPAVGLPGDHRRRGPATSRS
ncbi:WYL domain-containing protein [Micromonospora sp. NBRC 101691]|uniref:WYL domain-containing protein n=1 Tax=Micromonospora sp. NBRC 101691 TaxID=3032198 RepID=UPI0025562113|nr:WYL domain-containing protein [Micromonospora sp. NBRC 101691]